MNEEKGHLSASEERDRCMDEQLRTRFNSEKGRADRRKNVRSGFLICLALLLVAAVLNWGVVTGWGNVRIDRVKIIGNDGAEFSALVYVPKGAADTAPAPGIIMFHGNAGNARNHESWAVEFSRRGFVVLSIDHAAET